MFVLLSHKLNTSTPAYAGGPGLVLKPLKQIIKGDSSNSYLIEMPNHLGTHVDASRHFDPSGRSIADYGIESLIFRKPLLINVPKQDSELILVEDLETYKDRIAEADILLIKTGFQRFRSSDPERYSMHNPGLSSKAASYIVRNFPKLRALGLDTISLSSVDHREDGRLSHKILLSGRDFFIIEDMDLSELTESPKMVIVVPLFIEGVDSAPCVVLAEV
ncbi:MAG: cyclase family protein [Nitrososphaerota archaeon]|nr:cyclase family protein [Aigarchaeota archaeon]MDW8076822.1 cyclase family protein [Nitrososphaerota archaeon]